MQNGSTATRPKAGPGPVLAVLGAVLVIVSRFLEVGKVSTPDGSSSVTVKGNSAILIAGVILAVIGLLMWFVKSRTADRVLGVLAILAGAFGALIAGVMIGKDPIISTAADAVGATEAGVKQAVAAGRLTATVGLGAWLALIGSLLVIVAGIANLVSARKRKEAESPDVSMPSPVPTTTT